jgi:hypothetical protein
MLALVATVLIPIPDTDFDPTGVAVSWQVLTAHGHTVEFSTESGLQAVPDDMMLTGRGLDVWSKVPGLSQVIVVDRILRANRAARARAHVCQNSRANRIYVSPGKAGSG